MNFHTRIAPIVPLTPDDIEDELTVCPECNGRGWFYADAGPAPKAHDCDECGGSGEIEPPYDWRP